MVKDASVPLAIRQKGVSERGLVKHSIIINGAKDTPGNPERLYIRVLYKKKLFSNLYIYCYVYFCLFNFGVGTRREGVSRWSHRTTMRRGFGYWIQVVLENKMAHKYSDSAFEQALLLNCIYHDDVIVLNINKVFASISYYLIYLYITLLLVYALGPQFEIHFL